MELQQLTSSTSKNTCTAYLTAFFVVKEHPVMGGARLRMEISSHSYKEQSSARLDIFDPKTMTWKNLHTIRGHEMITPAKLAYTGQDPEYADFNGDVHELKRMAHLILE
jgi:hypothetical protein